MGPLSPRPLVLADPGSQAGGDDAEGPILAFPRAAVTSWDWARFQPAEPQLLPATGRGTGFGGSCMGTSGAGARAFGFASRTSPWSTPEVAQPRRGTRETGCHLLLVDTPWLCWASAQLVSEPLREPGCDIARESEEAASFSSQIPFVPLRAATGASALAHVAACASSASSSSRSHDTTGDVPHPFCRWDTEAWCSMARSHRGKERSQDWNPDIQPPPRAPCCGLQ